MAYKVIILYRLYMPSYFLGTFTEYPFLCFHPEVLFILFRSVLRYLHGSSQLLRTCFRYPDLQL